MGCDCKQGMQWRPRFYRQAASLRAGGTPNETTGGRGEKRRAGADVVFGATERNGTGPMRGLVGR